MKPQEALVLAAEVIHNRDLPSLAAALKGAAAELKALGEVSETLFVRARVAIPGKLFVEAIALTAEILATGRRYQMRVGAPYPRVGEFITEHDVTKSLDERPQADVARSLGEHEQPPSEAELRLAEAAYSASLYNDPMRLRFEFIGPADTRKWVSVVRAVIGLRPQVIQEPYPNA